MEICVESEREASALGMLGENWPAEGKTLREYPTDGRRRSTSERPGIIVPRMRV